MCWTEDDASEKKGELLTCAIEGALQRVLGARVVVHAGEHGVPTPEELVEGLILAWCFAWKLAWCLARAIGWAIGLEFGPGPLVRFFSFVL